jgi:hypothetical protein
MEEAAGGPYFGKLDPRARYYVKIDNTGDGREDAAYRWKFKQRFRNPEALDGAALADIGAAVRAVCGFAPALAHFPIVGLCPECARQGAAD